MVRIIIKGGVWKNTEDEVLKAAIAKYGKNQWARISSLLVRKTPKQCKARWYEWLDPSIKKTEWSKTEDEKLLHLAKLMPTQWRTIAPIVGRTATQCLERYQKLLDEAEAKENEELGLAGPGDEAGPSADDVRKLRPGEIDPDPENKPARPDPIDMDEDEKEMLSEARARLANTQGKKAKRKARERQLEEARRLAVLQKKRELKAAGIIMRHKSKKKGMDYNADIPFEKKAAPGFYDTSEEQARATAAPVGQSLRRLDNKRKPEDEDAERKKRQRRNAEGKGGNEANQTKFVAARDAQIQKLKEAEQIGKRRKLMLPPAQVGEAELEEIVKIGRAGETAKALVGREGVEASEQLLGEYERTPIRDTPIRDTPIRDNLRINPEDQFSAMGDTPREQRMRNLDAKRALKIGFSSLPKPANDFEVLVPEDEEDEDEAGIGGFSEEDAAERDARAKRQREEEERKELARRSHVVRHGLPRPANIDVDRLLSDLSTEDNAGDGLTAARQLINIELVQLMRHDSIAFPIPGTSRPGATQSFYVHPDDDDVATAKMVIHNELATLLGYPEANEETVRQGLIALTQAEEIDESVSWARERERLVYDAEIRTWVDPTTLSLEARFAGSSALLEDDREKMEKEAGRASKAEKKLNITLGGFQMRAGALTKRLTQAFSELQRTKIDLESFERLQLNESVTASRRVEGLKEEVEKLERKERTLQQRYKELEEERRERQDSISAAEERLMAEAEALNEAALEALEE